MKVCFNDSSVSLWLSIVTKLQTQLWGSTTNRTNKGGDDTLYTSKEHQTRGITNHCGATGDTQYAWEWEPTSAVSSVSKR